MSYRLSRMQSLAGIFGLLLLTAASTHASDRQDVEKAVAHWLGSFENLDMPVFIDCFTDDATVFFPSFVPVPDNPERVRSGFEQFRAIAPRSAHVAAAAAVPPARPSHISSAQQRAHRTPHVRDEEGAGDMARRPPARFQLSDAIRNALVAAQLRVVVRDLDAESGERRQRQRPGRLQRVRLLIRAQCLPRVLAPDAVDSAGVVSVSRKLAL